MDSDEDGIDDRRQALEDEPGVQEGNLNRSNVWMASRGMMSTGSETAFPFPFGEANPSSSFGGRKSYS